MIKKILAFIIICLVGCVYAFNNLPALNKNIVARADKNLAAEYAKMPIKEKYSMLIEHYDYYGEKEFAKRIEVAAKSLGWNIKSVNQATKHPELVKELNPDFSITLHKDGILKKDIPAQYKRYVNFTISNGSEYKKRWYQRSFSFIKKRHHNIINYDGFLFCYTDGTWVTEDYLKSHGKDNFNWIEFAPYVQDYTADFSIKNYSNPKMYYCGYNWDKLRKSKRYLDFYRFLVDDNKIDLYGRKKAWEQFPSAWKGELPFDGNSFLAKIAEYEVALVLHSLEHLSSGAPTSRIFEAAAVGNVIISDKHKFVMDNFGDAVLYIDETANSEEIYRQICKHLDWIKNNPGLALEKATRSHQIFKEKFTIEKNLPRIAQMHEYILQQELKQNKN